DRLKGWQTAPRVCEWILKVLSMAAASGGAASVSDDINDPVRQQAAWTLAEIVIDALGKTHPYTGKTYSEDQREFLDAQLRGDTKESVTIADLFNGLNYARRNLGKSALPFNEEHERVIRGYLFGTATSPSLVERVLQNDPINYESAIA